MLVGGPNAAVLACVNKVLADSEVTIRLHLGAADGKQTSVYCSVGAKTADDLSHGPLFLDQYVAPGGAQHYGGGLCERLPLATPKVLVIDQMDNTIELTEQGGSVTFNAEPSVWPPVGPNSANSSPACPPTSR